MAANQPDKVDPNREHLKVSVRDMRADEADSLGEIFFKSVRGGARGPYTEAQCAAWAPRPPSGPDWAARLASQDTVVGERRGRPIGFMALNRKTGHLDLAYVLPEAQGRGVAYALYSNLELRARTSSYWPLTTEASHLAKPFFLRHGWSVVARQTVERHGVTLENWRMEKKFPDSVFL